MKLNPNSLFARRSALGLQALALTAVLTVTAQGAAIITWDAGLAANGNSNGTDWATGSNWIGGAPPVSTISTDVATFSTATTGQPNLAASRSVTGVNFTNTGVVSRTLSGSLGAVLTLGADGIDAPGFRDGTINISVPTVMGSTSACNWSIFDNAASLPSATPICNLSGTIQIHGTAALQITSNRASSSTGVGTINLTGAIIGTGTGNVKYAGSSSSRGIINITGASSTYEAPTSTNAVTLNYDQLAISGQPSSFGTVGVINIGEGASATNVNYVGTGTATTDRQITFGLASGTAASYKLANNSATIGDAGAISFTSTASIVLSTATTNTNRTVLLGGTQAGSNTFAGLIQNNGTTGITSFLKSDAGMWILTNTSNSFTGGVSIASGILGIGSDTVLGVAGGAVNFTGNSNLVATGDMTLAAARTVTVSSGFTGQFGITSAATTTFIVDAKITGPGNISRRSGSAFTTGRVRFTNDTNDYTGVFDTRAAYTEFTSITDAGVASSLGKGTQINAVNGLSFTVLSYVGSGNSSTNRPIAWSGSTGDLHLGSNGTGTVSYLNTTPVMTADGTKTLILRGTNIGNNTFAQPINDGPTSGLGSLQKIEAGKWIVTAVNNYTGATVITGGTLALGAAATFNNSSTVDIATGATLDISAKAAAFAIPATQTLSGAGAVTGQSLNVAGTLAPGSAVTGTLSTAALTLQTGSIVNVSVDSSTVTADSLAVTGNLTIAANVTLNVADIAAVPVAVSTTLTIASFTGTLSGTFQGRPDGSTIVVGPNTFTISYGANAITLTSGSTPTPYSTWIDSFPSLTGGQKDKTADPDGDGMSNLQEFALDGNPASGVSSGKVQSSIATVSGSPYLTLSIPVRNGATFSGSPLASAEVDGVAYTILGSFDLATFTQTVVEVTPAIVSTPALSSGWSYRTFRLSATTTSQPKGFLRAKTSGPTP